MAQDLELNKLLHQIWDVDEKIANGAAITLEEKEFYNQHISTIQKYYHEKSEYWQSRKPI